VSAIGTLAELPRAAFEFANVILTTPDAPIGQTPREVVWTHRGTTLYRYRSSRREHAIPVLLVFALINRPEIFDLRPGSSFVEFLLSEGFDVFLLDWGVPDEEDFDVGLAEFICDELHWAVRETLHAAGEEELTLLGWCIGGTLCAIYCALHPAGAVRNAVLLTTPYYSRPPQEGLYRHFAAIAAGHQPRATTGPAPKSTLAQLGEAFFNWDLYKQAIPDLLRTGLPNTLILTISASIIGVLLGMGLAVAGISRARWLRWPARMYTDILRGLPEVVIILLIGLGVGPVVGGLTGNNPYPLGIAALGLMAAAYVGEIFRSGIQSV